MRHAILALIAMLALACGGGGSNSTPPPPPSGGGSNPTPTPTAPAPIPAGTYRSTAHIGALAPGSATPIGTVDQTLIVQSDGSSRLEMAGWNQAISILYADGTGTLQAGTDPRFTDANGVTTPLTLTGQLVGSRMTGTVNGGIPFDVTLTTIQDTAVDMTAKAGSYLTSASSNGQWIRLHLPATLVDSYNVVGEAYATQADALAKVNSLGTYNGTMSWQSSDPAHLKNCFNFGLTFQPTGAGSPLPGGTYGLAYFAPDGTFVALTTHPYSSAAGAGQLSGVFVKEP